MKKGLLTITGIFLFVILSFILSQEYILKNGTEVLLKTIPVDPRDLFMGDYVILNYDIAQLNKDKNNLQNNKTVYVSLDVDKDNVASARDILFNPPEDTLFLKGKVGGCNTTIPMLKSGKCVNFGIESYYVKENTGRELEKKLANGFYVKVKIDKNGKGKVVGFVE